MAEAARREPAGNEQEAAILDLLTTGEIDVQGRLVDASNATLYCTITADGRQEACVYKPVAGERPLWDFPDGTLAGREVAAYLVSRAAGWDVVPPTVYREGPFGPGMCQLWIDADESVDLVELARSSGDPRLRQMAVFDAVVNNADRKIGHLLPTSAGRLYGCDHGVCFGAEYKLRTVLWQWRGKKLTPAALAALRTSHELLAGGELADVLAAWLTRAEIVAMTRRIELLLENKVHPSPPTDWPAVPWPPI
ncbi:MAG: SCO1664 family protein [Actinobacteria bacterium]|nr:SCO1664 family protein [Actinomycetota bacterium]MBO0836917.1 SCO1664 family protein [Actinomycetota bacterium]